MRSRGQKFQIWPLGIFVSNTQELIQR